MQFRLGDRAMQRHASQHAPARSVASGDATDAFAELTEATREPALRGSNAGMTREYRLLLEAQAKRSAVAVPYNVLTDPEWLALRTRILRALEPFPEARAAVAEALR